MIHSTFGAVSARRGQFTQYLRLERQADRPQATLNSVGMIRRLAKLDMGIILMPEEIVADDLASGKLRRIMPAWHGAPMPVYAITETRLLPAKTQRFIEFLRERLGR
ncbi:LysR substrate-binding domain-containing protein [Cupriavidus oxalaticus]|uniref:LysR substrate-binding domain-containing protein n=1 Tax=Cupriavidus oxalaticus TaxID=96344 RepID=UPI003172B78B